MADIKVIYKNSSGLDNEHSESTDSVKMQSFKTANWELTDTKLGALIGGSDASTEHSHDSLYYREAEFINVSAGAGDAGKPIKTDATGKVDETFLDIASINVLLDHGVLAGLGDDDHTIYTKADGTRAFTGIQAYSVHPSFVEDKQLVDKKYVDDRVSGQEWYNSVISAGLLNPPASPATGDRYLINGVGTGGWSGKDYQIAEWNGTAWVYTVPTMGGHVSADDEQGFIYIFNGTSWDKKAYESTTASTGLVKVGNDIRIDSGAAGDGLGFSSGVLSVNVDNISLGITTDILQVKVDGIKDTMIDFGIGADQVSAEDIPIADVGGYFSTDNVEAALQKLASDIVAQGVEYTVGLGGVTKGYPVYITTNNTVVTHSDITTDEYVVGLPLTTVAASGTVKVLANDTVVAGVLSGAVAGAKVYWSGTGFQYTVPTGSNKNIWRVGIAKNSTDLSVEVEHVKKNA